MLHENPRKSGKIPEKSKRKSKKKFKAIQKIHWKFKEKYPQNSAIIQYAIEDVIYPSCFINFVSFVSFGVNDTNRNVVRNFCPFLSI